jgi:hypothetical protein
VLKLASCLALMLPLAPLLGAEPAPDAPELTRLLKEFLDGASRNDPAVHDRFWAPDLIYTGSSGRRIGKVDIMRDMRPPVAPPSPVPTPAPPAGPATVYSAEDVRIQQYGDTAIVAFRLVGTTATSPPTVSRYLNSGTFLKRDGRWQVVNWQATRARRAEDEEKRAAGALQAALRQALLNADAKALELLLDENFVWTRPDGAQVSRKQLLEPPASGPRNLPRLEEKDGAVTLHGDTAVVRGASYTLTLAYDGSAWKAVGLVSSGSSR